MNNPGYYAVHTRHDQGEITIFVFADNEAAAKHLVMRAERCPERAILWVTRQTPPNNLQPEDARWLETSGWEIVDDPDDDDCYALSARHWVEDIGGFDSKTEAVQFLREDSE